MTEAIDDLRDPEREVAQDMARLALYLGPCFVVAMSLFWGVAGLISSTLAISIVVVNLLLGAWIIARVAPISLDLLMGAVLGGFLFRLILLAVVVLPIRDFDWFATIPFSIALVGGHLSLLAWETQRVSMSFAYPGMPPTAEAPFSTIFKRSESDRCR